MKLFLKFFALGICAFYSLTLITLFILRVILLDVPPWIELLNTFAPFLFIPSPILVLLAFKMRSRFFLALSLSPFILFALAFGSLFIPRNATTSVSGEKALTVMTMNLGPGVAIPSQLADEIEQSNADIVAVQEMTDESANVLAKRLRSQYPYLILDSNAHTTGLLSRFPVRATEWFRPAGEGRAALYAEIDVNGTILNLIAPHPLPSNIVWWQDRPPFAIGIDDSAQQRELADIAQRAQTIAKPVIVLGDLNISDQTRAYPTMANYFRDAYREVGWGFGFTFPSGLRVRNFFPTSGGFGSLTVPGPWLRLDYVFHSDDLVAESAQVLCRGGSDHCYLIVRLGKR